MPGLVDQKPTTGTIGIGARAGVRVGAGDVGVGLAARSAVELGLAGNVRSAVAGLLGSVVEVGAGLAQPMTMAASSSPLMDRRAVHHMCTVAAYGLAVLIRRDRSGLVAGRTIRP